MADQNLTLSQRFELAIQEHLAARGGGFCNGFVALAETVDEDGEDCVFLVSPDFQRSNRSFGMAKYLSAYWANEVRHLWDGTCDHDGDEEDDE